MRRRVAELGAALALPEVPAAADEIRRVVTVFRELRTGATEDGRISLKVPTGTLSTAEAISVVTNGARAGRPLRRRRAAPDRRGGRHRRRGRQRPGPRHRGLARVPRSGRARPRRDGATSTTPAATSTCERATREPAPARHPAPRPRLGAVGARRARRARPRHRARRAARRRASRRCAGSATSTWCRRWRCWATSSTDRPAPRSCRSPRSAPSGRRSPGRTPTTCRCAPSTCRSRHAGRARRRRQPRTARLMPPPPDPLRDSPRQPATPTPNAGGRTSSSTAATAPRRSTPSPRRWRAAAAGHAAAAREAATRGAHAPGDPHGAPRRPSSTIVVVCGAWHVPALDLDGDRTRRRAERVRRCRHTARAAEGEGRRQLGAVDPRRLAARSGYGAGVAAPAGTATCSSIPGPTASPGSSSTPPDSCATVAAPRRPTTSSPPPAWPRRSRRCADRPRVGLAEVLDAADAVMGGLDLVRRELVVGDAIGEVPDDAPQVPLARDLAKLAEVGPASR